MRRPDLEILQRPLQSDDDVNAAFGLLAWVQSRRKALESQCALEIARAREKLVAASQLEVGDETFSFDEVARALTASITGYGQAQRERLFTERKTARFDLGEIRIRKRSASVSLAEGETAKAVLSRIQEPRYLRVKKELDLPAIKSDRQKELISDEQLAALGLVYDPGEDEWIAHLTGS